MLFLRLIRLRINRFKIYVLRQSIAHIQRFFTFFSPVELQHEPTLYCLFILYFFMPKHFPLPRAIFNLFFAGEFIIYMPLVT